MVTPRQVVVCTDGDVRVASWKLFFYNALITDLMAMLEGVDEAVYPYVKESVISLLKLWNYKKDNPGESCG